MRTLSRIEGHELMHDIDAPVVLTVASQGMETRQATSQQ